MTGIIISNKEKDRIKCAVSAIKKIIKERKVATGDDFYEFSLSDLLSIVRWLDSIEFYVDK